MAERARRNIRPPLRYGFNELDVSSEDESEDIENCVSSSSESSPESSSEEETTILPSRPTSDSSECIHPSYDCSNGWRVVLSGSDVRENSDLNYSDSSGLQFPLPEKPEDFALHLLDEEVFTALADWTNSRARLRNYSDVNRFGHRKHTVKWSDVTSDDMKQFFAMILVMSVIRKPNIRDYFSSNIYLDTPFFRRSDNFSRDRFSMILSNLRFADYEAHPERIAKIQPIIDLLREKIQSVYKIEGRGSIDEFLVLHKGRLYLKQYIPKKRARFGVKIFSLNESTSAYTYDVEIYCGQETGQHLCADLNDVRELSLSEKVIVHLLHRSNLLDKGFQVIADNWFQSVRLVHYLLERNTTCFGTIRPNRGVPRELMNFRLKPVSSEFARNGDILLTKFHDKREVYIVSSAHIAGTIPKQRSTRHGERLEIRKPSVIEDYNFAMNGTDRIDQMMANVQCHRKTFAWPKKIGLHMLQRLGIVNGFVLARKYMNNLMRLKNLSDYQLLVVESLLHLTSTGRPRRPLTNRQHSLVKIEGTPTRPRPARPCRYCRQNVEAGQRVRESRYFCNVCDDHPPLHMGDCFEKYHSSV